MSVLPARLAIAATAALSRASSFATSAMPSLFSAASLPSSISVANTVAPSRANATAQARPIPTAAAVTKARLPFRRSDMVSFSLLLFRHCEERKRRSNPVFGSGLLPPSLVELRRTSRSARNDGGCLMIIPGDADLAGDVVIARGQLHAGAGGLLADGRAIELLPRRLVGRVGEAAFGLQLRATLLDLLVRDQDVGAALVEVDADLVAGLEDREPAVGGGFRRGVQDRW